MDHRHDEELGELSAEPGLSRAGRTEECDALHVTRMERVHAHGKG
jgi:hypothetical protein